MSALYPAFKEQLLQAGVNLSSGTVKAALVNSTSEPYNSADVFYSDVTSPIGTPQTLTSKTYTGGVFDAADVTFSAVSGSTVNGIVIFVDTGTATTSRLVAYIDGITVTPNGGSIVVTWDNGTNRIFAL